MNKNEIAPGVWVYNNFIKDTEILIEDIKNYLDPYFSEAYGLTKDGEPVINKMGRDCSDYAFQDEMIDSLDDNQKFIFLRVKNPMVECLKDYKLKYFLIDDLNDTAWIFLRYGEDQQFGNHMDDGPICNRMVSVTAYLNDDYDNGEIFFQNFNVSYKPKKGDILVFPSNFLYVHRVNPVKNGIRYAVVNWFRWFSLPENANEIKEINRKVNAY
jgi:hypothetical protein